MFYRQIQFVLLLTYMGNNTYETKMEKKMEQWNVNCNILSIQTLQSEILTNYSYLYIIVLSGYSNIHLIYYTFDKKQITSTLDIQISPYSFLFLTITIISLQ